MKSILLSLFLISLTSTVFAQGSWSMGLSTKLGSDHLTITQSYAELSSNGIYEESGVGLDWEVGLQSQYQFADKYQFGMALSFQEATFRHYIKGLRFPDPMFEGRDDSFIDNRIKYRSLNLTIIFNKLFYKRESLDFYFGFSGILKRGLTSKTKAILDHDGLEDFEYLDATNEMNSSWLAIGTHLGAQKEISDRLSFQVQGQITFNRNDFTLYLLQSEAISSIQPALQLNVMYRLSKKRSKEQKA